MVAVSPNQMYSMLKAYVATFRQITNCIFSNALVDATGLHHINRLTLTLTTSGTFTSCMVNTFVFGKNNADPTLASSAHKTCFGALVHPHFCKTRAVIRARMLVKRCCNAMLTPWHPRRCFYALIASSKPALNKAGLRTSQCLTPWLIGKVSFFSTLPDCEPWNKITTCTTQGGGGNFKNRKFVRSIGRVGCCESRMAERIHWWTDRWLELCFVERLRGCGCGKWGGGWWSWG